ncbi:gliding motility-associated C-terminal domain-containing protein, partial [Saprospiraceae bacterium]|nr:gliding motility-associated C-terminal domain-containing protein [Saprospiraceae bacterium]
SITIDDSNVTPVVTFDPGIDGSRDGNNNLTWTSPGEKIITVNVETLDGCIGSSQQMVTVQDSIILGPISCAGEGLDFVIFDWDDVANATDYSVIYTINGGAPMDSILTESMLEVTGLENGDVVNIIVTANPAAGFCDTGSQMGVCQASNCMPITLGPISCPGQGLDFVIFDWEDVGNVIDYSITYTINGVSVDTTVTDSMIEINGLGTGTTVDITVTANPEAGFCNTPAQSGDCTTSNCPPITFAANEGPFCFGAGSNPVDLELMIFDEAGVDVTDLGVVEWLDTRVDVNDMFDPGVSTDNEDYPLSFSYTDQDGCESIRDIIVQVLAQPEPEIAAIDGFCVDANGVVELVGTFDNGEDIVWEWDGGGATGAGPHDIAFAQAGQYIVTVTVTNGADVDGDACEGIATQTVIVDPQLDDPDFALCSSNNTGVTFSWAPVTNASEYEILVDGVLIGTQDSLTFMIPAVPGESFDIEVIAISSNNCGNSSATDSCTATDCAPADFEPIMPVEMCLDGTQMPVQFDAVFVVPPPGNPVVPGTWSSSVPGAVTPDGLFDPTGLSPGTITLDYIVEYAQQCTYPTSATVILYEAPEILNVDPINSMCHMNSEGMIELIAEGGTLPYSYQLNNLPAQPDGLFSPLSPGVYGVTVTDVNGCTNAVGFEIVPFPEPGLDIGGATSLGIGDSETYTIENFPQNDDYVVGDVIWTAEPANGGETVIICDVPDCIPEVNFTDYPTLAEGFDLTVTVFFNGDCFVDATLRVDVITSTRYYIPNVFSNNSSNNINQSWSMFVSSDAVVVNSVRVYDRWGELVYVKEEGLDSDPNADNRVDLGWAGQFADSDPDNVDEDVIQGVYVYVIEINDDGKNVIESGDLTVLR